MSGRTILLGLFLVLAVCLNPPALHAAGLSTTFGEVTLEDLENGKTYSTKESAGLPLIVVNTGEDNVDLKTELLLPDPSELKEGFEPIPDLGWIRIERTDFAGIPPNDSAETDVFISIPDDEQHAGKKYQVFIWSHTTGGRIGVGLKSKLLICIKGPEEKTQ